METYFLSHLIHLASTLPDPATEPRSHISRIMRRTDTLNPPGRKLTEVSPDITIRFENIVATDENGAIRKVWATYGLVIIDITGDPRDDYSGPNSLSPVLRRR